MSGVARLLRLVAGRDRARGRRDAVARVADRHRVRLDGPADADRPRRHERRHQQPDRGAGARAAVHGAARGAGQPHGRIGQPPAAGAAGGAARRRGRGPAAHRHDHPAARAGRAERARRRDLDPPRLLRHPRRRERPPQDQLRVRAGHGRGEGRSARRRGSPVPSSTGGPATPAAARWSRPSRSSPGSRSTTTRRSTWPGSSR